MNKYFFIAIVFWGIGVHGAMPLREEIKRPQDRTLEELNRDVRDPNLNEDQLIKMRSELARAMSATQDPQDKWILQEKINIVQGEMNRRVAAAPPTPTDVPVQQQSGRSYVGSNITIDNVGDTLSNIIDNPRHTGAQIVSTLDLISRYLNTLPVVTDIALQMRQNEALSSMADALEKARNDKIGALYKEDITKLENRITARQVDVVDDVLRDQIQKIYDASLAKGPQTVWRSILDKIAEIISLLTRGFRSDLTRDLNRAVDLFKELEATTEEAQTTLDQMGQLYGPSLRSIQRLVARDISNLSMEELRQLREALSSHNLTVQGQSNAYTSAFNVFKADFGRQIDRLMKSAQGITSGLSERVLKPQFSSLYDQFQYTYGRAFGDFYSLRQEPGKGWLPQALGFPSYRALLEAPVDLINERWEAMDVPANRGKPEWQGARELQLIMSEPISRENFRTYLDEEGLIDSYKKQGVVNRLMLSGAAQEPLAEFANALNTASARLAASISLASPLSDGAVQADQAVKQKIAQIDARIKALGELPVVRANR